MVQSLRQMILRILLRRGEANVSSFFFFLILYYNLSLISFGIYRRKWGDSIAEPGQEETPKKEFFVKGDRKPHFGGARNHTDKASGGKGDRTHFRPKSNARSGNSQNYRGGKSQGRDTRPRNGAFNSTPNRGTRQSAHSPRFKKARTAAT
jgi:hypothetical protein